MTGTPLISIIVPVLNEADGIAATLSALQALRETGHEVIVVDGGSADETVSVSAPWADRVIHAGRGRARQMNAGAEAAGGEILLFLHADTRLPVDAARLIGEGLDNAGKAWGRFDVRLSGHAPLLRVIEYLMNQRSRLTGIATGDQAMFVRRELFDAVGGFPGIVLMEDIALSRLLKRYGRPLCLRRKVVTSSRCWEQRGIVRTILLMWRLRLAYALGVDPKILEKLYR